MCGRVRGRGIALRACEAARDRDINREDGVRNPGLCERVYGRCELRPFEERNKRGRTSDGGVRFAQNQRMRGYEMREERGGFECDGQEKRRQASLKRVEPRWESSLVLNCTCWHWQPSVPRSLGGTAESRQTDAQTHRQPTVKIIYQVRVRSRWPCSCSCSVAVAWLGRTEWVVAVMGHLFKFVRDRQASSFKRECRKGGSTRMRES